jgi:hypothetical protein
MAHAHCSPPGARVPFLVVYEARFATKKEVKKESTSGVRNEPALVAPSSKGIQPNLPIGYSPDSFLILFLWPTNSARS